MELIRRANEKGFSNLRPQNVNNIINGQITLGVQRAREIEIALKLPPKTLTDIIVQPNGADEIIKKVDEKARKLKMI